MGDRRPLQWCNILQAALNLREGYVPLAWTSLQREFKSFWRKEVPILAYCLERLCDVSCQNGLTSAPIWATVLLAHSVKFRGRAGIYKALRFLAAASLTQGDEDTAISLFTIALDGLTHMDVHQSRAECMLGLGDIYMGRGNTIKAVELWKTARPLFEQSSQTKQVEIIVKRLSGTLHVGDK